jgi:hypothetical protein
MSALLSPREVAVVSVHLVFAVVCAVVLVLPIECAIGVRLFLLVLFYNVMMPVVGLMRRDSQWLRIWFFAFILSVFQVFPDWFLASELEVLVFPTDGLFKIGPVSGYMAGLWAVPIYILIFIGTSIEGRFSRTAAYFAVALCSLLIFGISEQTLWLLPSWYAHNVHMVGHGAVYILVPEVLLGLAAFFCFHFIREKSRWLTIPAAFFVMLFYLGSAAFFYLVIEGIFKGVG